MGDVIQFPRRVILPADEIISEVLQHRAERERARPTPKTVSEVFAQLRDEAQRLRDEENAR